MTGVRVVSKDQCKYCTLAKAFLKEQGIPFAEERMDPADPTYAARRAELVEATGQTTFPWIFVGDALLGGHDDLVHAFNTQRLHGQLAAAGIAIAEPDF